MARVLLGILASPRKFGNCELFVKELYRKMEGDWQLRLVRLPALDIQPCRACYQCLFEDARCPQKDDFNLVLNALMEADAYVVAAPTYLLSANSSLKRFLDRGLSFYAHLDRLWQKPAVGVAIAGIEGLEGSTKLNVESFIKLTLGDFRGSEVVYAALPGEIFLKGAGGDAATRLAALLSGGAPVLNVQAPTCSICGGDTFRFLGHGEVRCMLCSSSGKVEIGEGQISIRTRPGEHPLFLSYEDVKRHADWLRQMKDEFLKHRKELKAVAQQYTQIGEWIRPDMPTVS
jgi:multimeric flavodoxin WrbA